MPQDRTALGFNVGTEWDLTLTVNQQVVQEFGLLEARDRHVLATLIDVTPVNNNGVSVRRNTFHGFKFTYGYVRQDDALDDLVDALVAAYKAQARAAFFSGVETVINAGVASQWLYTGGILHPDGLGNIKNADKTDGVTFEIYWSDRQKIRGASSAPSLVVSAGL